jgi:hypothetical protein
VSETDEPDALVLGAAPQAEPVYWWHLYRQPDDPATAEDERAEPYLHGPSAADPEHAATLGHLLTPAMDYVTSWQGKAPSRAQQLAALQGK